MFLKEKNLRGIFFFFFLQKPMSKIGKLCHNRSLISGCISLISTICHLKTHLFTNTAGHIDFPIFNVCTDDFSWIISQLRWIYIYNCHKSGDYCSNDEVENKVISLSSLSKFQRRVVDGVFIRNDLRFYGLLSYMA